MSKPLSAWDKLTLQIAPRWTVQRLRARSAALEFARHYEAAQPGRRTAGWKRTRGDANAVLLGQLVELRIHARDLVRNNSWARKAQHVIANNATGSWGIVPKPLTTDPKLRAKAMELWKAWAGSVECESEGRHTFYGLQHLVMKSIYESGEVLVRRRARRPSDGLTIPLQIQILEADYLDSSKNFTSTDTQGPTVQGVEFDLIGRRNAYWIFPTHPGNAIQASTSVRVPASEILHIYYTERPGQARGASWLATSIVNMKDLDEYEDATLMKQKISACFAAFVSDMDGMGSGIGGGTDSPLVESFEPGMVSYLPPGKEISFATPPTVSDYDAFTKANLRKIAAGLGVTYEDMTGDYSQVNFSSARMSRIAHWGNVRDWQYNMLIPLFCDGIWDWAMAAAVVDGTLPSAPKAEWTTPPMPMIEPDKEGLAYSRLVRNGVMTHSEMIREQGGDPETHWKEYQDGLKTLDALGIVLDSDVRAVSQAGQVQIEPADPSADAAPAPKPPPKKA